MERFDRLLEEQQKALSQTDNRIEILKLHMEEYARLKARLEDTSKLFSKCVILPFSPRAFVTGRLVHTNEVLIYLGGSENHFCETSTANALSIIDKRIAHIERETGQLEEQRRLLTDRKAYTQKLVSSARLSDVSDDKFSNSELEIREEFDPDKEMKWRVRHRMHVIEEKARERAARSSHSSPFGNLTFFNGPLEESKSLPDIIVRNSDVCARRAISQITSWHTASPADVVLFIQENREAKTPNSLNPTTVCQPALKTASPEPDADICSTKNRPSKTDPFHPVLGHKTIVETVNYEPNKRISLFRLKRAKNM